MPTTTIRLLLALTAFLLVTEWSGMARADVTISGTVGEIGIQPNAGGATCPVLRFKLTDATQTATCVEQGNGAGNKYAYFYNNNSTCGGFDSNYAREWYAALLVSKKGAPISCTVTSATNCHVTSCTLP